MNHRSQKYILPESYFPHTYLVPVWCHTFLTEAVHTFSLSMQVNDNTAKLLLSFPILLHQLLQCLQLWCLCQAWRQTAPDKCRPPVVAFCPSHAARSSLCVTSVWSHCRFRNLDVSLIDWDQGTVSPFIIPLLSLSLESCWISLWAVQLHFVSSTSRPLQLCHLVQKPSPSSFS